MIYDIRSESDFLTGASLLVKIPQDDLDKEALYTIQAGRPEFILPFRFRSVDGHIEFIYQIGDRCRLQYLSGQRPPKEYAALWSNALYPLRDCGDWFMKPQSFVLDVDYLYCDKNDNTVNYVYIPSLRACSGPDDLKDMAADITKYVTIADSYLENRVLRAILKDFEPNSFLRMLKTYVAAAEPVSDRQQDEQYITAQAAAQTSTQTAAQTSTQAAAQATVLTNSGAVYPPQPAPNQERPALRPGAAHESTGTKESNPGDIVINIPVDGTSRKKMEKGIKEREPQGAEYEASIDMKKRTGWLFGRKKEARGEETADKTPIAPESELRKAQPTARSALARSATPRNAAMQNPAVRNASAPEDAVCVTQYLPEQSDIPELRLVGNTQLPPRICVYIPCGEIYTVGRFDAALGKRQCSFEFENRTKAVSRRHAAIERDANGYCIIDLASSAGTYVNGKKLPPNTPCQLGRGCHVSFGNAGADYIWEG